MAAGGVVLVPLTIGVGLHEGFRLPKELLFYAIAIIVVTIVAAGTLLGRIDMRTLARDRALLRLTAVAVVWSLITAALASNRALSAHALVWFFASLAIFFSFLATMRGRSHRWLALLLGPAAVNAILLLLQARHVWNPFRFPEGTTGRMMYTALIGNADDVGVYLAIAAVAAIALAVVDRQWRLAYSAAAALLIVATLATLTVTAIAAMTIGSAVLLARGMRHTGVVVAVALVAALLIAMRLYTPLWQRFVGFGEALRSGNVQESTGSRFAAFATTWEMFKDHPLTGVGPGCFPFEYMPYRVILDQRHPLLGGAPIRGQFNFGEAHNDHLQLLAENGVLGYAIFIGALVLLASVSFGGGEPADPRPRLARALALPLAVTLFVACIAQFPLHLAAPLYELLFAAAACLAWRDAGVA